VSVASGACMAATCRELNRESRRQAKAPSGRTGTEGGRSREVPSALRVNNLSGQHSERAPRLYCASGGLGRRCQRQSTRRKRKYADRCTLHKRAMPSRTLKVSAARTTFEARRPEEQEACVSPDGELAIAGSRTSDRNRCWRSASDRVGATVARGKRS
jgi:hypothetical protein